MTCVITSVDMYQKYHNAKQQIHERLNNINTAYLSSITNSVWNFNEEQLMLLMQGIYSLPDISYVEVGEKAEILYSIGNAKPKDSKHEVIVFQEDLMFLNNSTLRNIGYLKVHASMEATVESLFEMAIFVFVSHFLKTIIISLFMWLVLYRMIIRHILQMGNYFQKLKLGNEITELKLNRESEFWADYKDEMDFLAESIRTTLNKLNQENNRKLEYEKQLRYINQNLEEEAQRKMELIWLQKEQIKDQESMAAIGKMASAMSHEINNPLTNILGSVGQLQIIGEKNKNFNETIENKLEIIHNNSLRIADIIKNLQEFSAENISERCVPTDFTKLVARAVSLCKEKFKKHRIELDINIKLDNPIIQAYPSKISRLVYHLLNNAYDAVIMEEKPWVGVELSGNDEFIFLKVSDTGPSFKGIEIQEILRPFNLPRNLSRNVGLGMSAARGLAVMHDGEITVEQEKGLVHFLLKLPRTNQKNTKHNLELGI